MSTVRQVALEEDLMGVVAAAAQPLPNRPDGTVVVVLYSSEQDYGCMATDQEFERMSEKYTDCVFLVCHKEYVGSDLTMSSRRITAVPAFEVFSRGSSVGTIFGPRLDEVEKKIRQFGFSLSKTDLFSDTSEYNLSSFDQQFPDGPGSGGVDASKGGKGEASNPWDDAADKAARAGRRTSSKGAMAAPRTTARYFPGFGMGQDAAENVEKKGSTLDEFQRARQGAAFGGVKIPDYVPGEGGGPGKGFYETAAEAFREGLTETFKKPPAEKGPQRNGDDDDAEDLLNGLWDVPEYK